MPGGIAEPADFVFDGLGQFSRAEAGQGGGFPALEPDGEGGTARDGGGATLHLEARFGDGAVVDAGAEAEAVAAGGVFRVDDDDPFPAGLESA